MYFSLSLPQLWKEIDRSQDLQRGRRGYLQVYYRRYLPNGALRLRADHVGLPQLPRHDTRTVEHRQRVREAERRSQSGARGGSQRGILLHKAP